MNGKANIVVGRSRKGSYSLQEAFEDALRQMRSSLTSRTDRLLEVEVVRLGAEVGGLADFDNAFVELRRR